MREAKARRVAVRSIAWLDVTRGLLTVCDMCASFLTLWAQTLQIKLQWLELIGDPPAIEKLFRSIRSIADALAAHTLHKPFALARPPQIPIRSMRFTVNRHKDYYI